MAEKKKNKKIKEVKEKEINKDTPEKQEDYAIIKISGGQMKVSEGKTYETKKISGKPGDKVELKDVLLVKKGKKVKVGKPLVDGAKVTLEIVEQKKGKKVRTFKYKAKSRYRKTRGSRQHLTVIKVVKIQ